MAKKKLLVEGCRNGRYHRTQRRNQKDKRSSKGVIGELTSSNYTIQETVTESGDDVRRYWRDGRRLRSAIDGSIGGRSREMGDLSHQEGAITRHKGDPDSLSEEWNCRYGNCAGGRRTMAASTSGNGELRRDRIGFAEYRYRECGSLEIPQFGDIGSRQAGKCRWRSRTEEGIARYQNNDARRASCGRCRGMQVDILAFGRYLPHRDPEFEAPEGEGEIELYDGDSWG